MDHTEQIGDFEFTIRPMGAKLALRMNARLLRAIGPGVERLNGMGEASMLQAFGAMCASLDENDVDYFREQFAKHCKVKDTTGRVGGGNLLDLESVFDVVFAGKPSLTISWLAANFKVHLADFFSEQGEGRKLLALLMKPAASNSPKESSGQSGESSQAPTSTNG